MMIEAIGSSWQQQQQQQQVEHDKQAKKERVKSK